MFGLKANRRKAGKEEAEKPFWISFSDLMTALMVLFLVAMAVALIAVTHGLATINKDKEDRAKDIQTCIASVDKLTQETAFQGMSVHGNSISFGTLVLFNNAAFNFPKPGDADFIRSFAKDVLNLAHTKECKKWLKRIVVEGFASPTGGFLYNLNLSYLRSQSVMQALLDSQATNPLSPEQQAEVETLFFPGGLSFNAPKGVDGLSRRVELRLEFRELEKECAKTDGKPNPVDDSKCP